MATSYSDSIASAQSAPVATRRRYLFGPVVDFVTFGGLSLVLLPLMLLLPASDQVTRSAMLATMLLSHIINHPHFAHSYQIFYRGFAAKAFGDGLNPVMRLRYQFAGIAVPFLITAYLGWSCLRGDARLLGYAGNAMALFVGWHYVKQGYGLLMVDCALKRQFFSAADKRVLLINCYAVWTGAWLWFNASAEKTDMLGLSFYAFDFPAWLVSAGLAATMTTSLAAALTLARAWRSAGALPLNGIAAYVASLYPWLILIKLSPLWLLLVPAFHSLQYLGVVWRFEINREKSQTGAEKSLLGSSLGAHLAKFVIAAVLLGYLGFLILPGFADSHVGYDKSAIGGSFFAFAALIFINVHHYFIDNVIWRRENPESQAHLFA